MPSLIETLLSKCKQIAQTRLNSYLRVMAYLRVAMNPFCIVSKYPTENNEGTGVYAPFCTKQLI